MMDRDDKNTNEINVVTDAEMYETPSETGLTVIPPTPAHALIQDAQKILESESLTLTNVQQYMPESYQPPQSPTLTFEKFPEVTNQLRSDVEHGGVDLYRVRKLNLAATVETLERAVTAHENFPSADAGIAVAKLSEQVSQLTKELEKAQDPYALYGKIVEEAMEPLTSDVVRALAEESKWLIQQFEPHVAVEKRIAFKETVKEAIMRVAPTLKESLEVSKQRLLRSLNLKDSKK